MSEQGAGWVPDHLAVLDRYASYGDLVRDPLGAGHLSKRPSEYFAQQCYVGASFLAPPELAQLDRIGTDRVLWGSDYPHREGTWPYSRESLRFTFAGVDPAAVRRMVGTNAADLYGFDLDALVIDRGRCVPDTGRCRGSAHHAAFRHDRAPPSTPTPDLAEQKAAVEGRVARLTSRSCLTCRTTRDGRLRRARRSRRGTAVVVGRHRLTASSQLLDRDRVAGRSSARDAGMGRVDAASRAVRVLVRAAVAQSPQPRARIHRSSWRSTTPSNASRSKAGRARSADADADPYVDLFARKYEDDPVKQAALAAFMREQHSSSK